MATFEVRVEGLTGLSIDASSNPTQDELTEYLKDGVIEITDRIIALKPEEVDKFMRSTTSDSQGVDVGSAKVISVMREANTDGSSDGSTAWRDCKLMPPTMQSRVVDSTSLHYASLYNPVYIQDNNGVINVYPVPSSNNGIKVFHVNKTPVNGSSASLEYNHDDILYFPEDKVYLVVLYAGVKSLENALSAKNITLETSLLPDDIVFDSITLSLPTYTSPSDLVLPVSPTAPTMSEKSVTLPTTQPSYTQPIFSVPSTPTFDSLVLPVQPSTPSDPSFSDIDVSSTTITSLGPAPTFTKPAVASDSAGIELTTITALDGEDTIDDADGNAVEFDQWWTTAAHLIEGEEDIDLATVHLQKIDQYLRAYQQQLAANTADFQKESSIYLAELDKAKKQAEIDSTRFVNNAQLDQAKEQQEYAAKVNKYTADIQKWSTDVTTSIQKWMQEEYTAKYTTWITEFNSGIQKYSADIQNALNVFNKENTIYQAEVQESLQEAQLAESKEARDIQLYSSQLQNYTADVTKETGRFSSELGEIAKEFESNLQKYAAEVQNVTSINQNKIADYSAKIQKSQIRLQQYQVDYGWMEARLAKLQAEYDNTFVLMGGKSRQRQQQQEERRR